MKHEAAHAPWKAFSPSSTRRRAPAAATRVDAARDTGAATSADAATGAPVARETTDMDEDEWTTAPGRSEMGEATARMIVQPGAAPQQSLLPQPMPREIPIPAFSDDDEDTGDADEDYDQWFWNTQSVLLESRSLVTNLKKTKKTETWFF